MILLVKRVLQKFTPISLFSEANINTAKTYVYGIIAGVPVPFEVPPDACEDMKCPITTGTSEIYTNSIYCDPSYPEVSTGFEVKSERTSG